MTQRNPLYSSTISICFVTIFVVSFGCEKEITTRGVSEAVEWTEVDPEDAEVDPAPFEEPVDAEEKAPEEEPTEPEEVDEPLRIPNAWQCGEAAYIDDTCDCGCGAFDPSCENQGIEACEESLHCGGVDAVNPRDTANCVEDSTAPAPQVAPESWTCPNGWYDDSDCDCGCGSNDPTCGVNYDVSACEYQINCTQDGLVVNPADPTTCIEDTTNPVPEPPVESSCNILVCLTGAVDQNSASNTDFTEICDELADDFEILQDCSEGECFSTWDTFSVSVFPSSWDNKVEDDIMPALTSRLDTNSDGIVNNQDENCSVSILGFSWGGVNSTRLAHSMWNDLNYSVSRSSVRTMVVLDPFQPLGQEVDVPQNVEKFWSYRHTVAGSNDCSSGSPLGPYLGIAPTCAAGVDCTDYDYSADLDRDYPTRNGNALSGWDIGHCRVPTVSRIPAKANLTQRVSFSGALPPRVPLQ